MWFSTVSSEALRKFMVIGPSVRPSFPATFVEGASVATAGGTFVSAGVTAGVASFVGGVDSGLVGVSFCCRAQSVEIPAASAVSTQKVWIVFIGWFRLLLGVVFTFAS